MEQILIAVIPVAVIGLICAAVLVIASKIMAVKEDERFPKVRECLPGANCGACGFAGCDGYAKALCDNPDTPTNLCTPGADSVAKQLSEVLGVEFAAAEAKVAFVHCGGDCEHTGDKVDYMGFSSCTAANLLFGGKGECTYGCLGMGDCAAVCTQNAIIIENGVAKVCEPECKGCGVCVKACPNHLISLVPKKRKVTMTCSSHDKGAVTRKICTNGCIGCKKCEKVCPRDAIHVIRNVAVIDYEKCIGCKKCAKECTAQCILM